MLGKVTIIRDNGQVHVYHKLIDREIALSVLVDKDNFNISGTYFSDGGFDLDLKAKFPVKYYDLNVIFTPQNEPINSELENILTSQNHGSN